MDSSLISLALLLGNLRVPTDVSSFRQRKTIQKLVYLAQAAGLRGRYSYGWYVYGPYSPDLTQDYFRLQEHVDLSPDALEELQSRYELSPQVQDAMTKVQGLMQVPPELGEDRLADWLELLASYHFLRTRSGLDHAKAKEVLQTRKPHVSDYADLAQENLASRGVLDA